MTKDEAAQIARTITGAYLELWKQAFSVLDPKKTVLVDPATRAVHIGPANHFEAAGGEN